MEFEQKSKQILIELFRDRKALKNLILNAGQTLSLLSLSKSYETVDRLILKEEGELQIRLHIYNTIKSPASLETDISKLHNHPWDFSSCILSGGYTHFIAPSTHCKEMVGDCYTLLHTEFHTVAVLPDTVTLLVRGKPQRELFQVMEKGEIKDVPKLTNVKDIDQTRYQFLLDRLIALKIIEK